MSPLDLLRDFPDLAVRELALSPDLVCVAAESIAPSADCPSCGLSSGHVHSRYVRTIADLSWQGRQVILRLTVRRFRCRTDGCERTVFCERLPQVVATQARTTDRLTAAHRVIGFALGGEAGARLCDHLAMPTSPDTLLRRVKAAPAPAHPTPRVLGVDDFAFRKGTTYGTILVDLERRCVVDLLPDRTAETLADWLRRHPGVEVISRDRAPAYAQAATAAAPRAEQVADRFHLLTNVREAVEQVLARHPKLVREALTDPPTDAPPASQTTAEPESPYRRKERELVAGRRERRRERYEHARQMREQGLSLRQIGRALRMSPGSILRYLRTGHIPDWRPGRIAPSQLDPYRDHIDRWLTAGCRNARVLHQELRGLGYTGGYDQVRRAVRKRTGVNGRLRLRGPIPPRCVEIPSPRQLSFVIARRPDRRSEDEGQQVERLRSAEGAVGAAVGLGEQFAAAIRDRSVTGLEVWWLAAAASDLPEFRGLARSMRQDGSAVRAGVLGIWSNGQVEGQVHRLKLLKRLGYGRAGFELLKARVLNSG